MAYGQENVNYNFSVQKEPKKRMGAGDFANMPKDPIMSQFSDRCEYRSGVPNSFVASVRDLTGISENQK